MWEGIGGRWKEVELSGIEKRVRGMGKNPTKLVVLRKEG